MLTIIWWIFLLIVALKLGTRVIKIITKGVDRAFDGLENRIDRRTQRRED